MAKPQSKKTQQVDKPDEKYHIKNWIKSILYGSAGVCDFVLDNHAAASPAFR